MPERLRAADRRAIQRQVRSGRYKAHPGRGGYASANPAHGFDIRYRNDGTTEVARRNDDTDSWRLGLRLAGVGYAKLRPVPPPKSLQADDNRLAYARGDNLTEWWVNNRSGLEQWFELASPPAGRDQGELLRLALAVSGDFATEQQADAVVFSNSETELTYADLVVWDATGEQLPSRMAIAGERLVLAIDDAGARYPIIIDPTLTQEAYLKASNAESGDRFGWSVDSSDDTVVVGAPLESSDATGVDGNQGDNSTDDAGAAYVFVRDGAGNWSQQAYLKASNTDAFDHFGSSVGIDGDTVVIGAIGEDSSAIGVNGNQADDSALTSGAAYVFTRNATGNWSQQAYLKASNTGSFDNFGASVNIDGDTIVVGANREDSAATGVNGNQADDSEIGAGAAYVFGRSGTAWSQQAYLKASNTESPDEFGTSVDVAGDTIVVGAVQEDSQAVGVNGNQADNEAFDAGAAYVFARDGAGTWAQQAYLKASNTDSTDNFGNSVSVDGDTIVIGAEGEDSSATGVGGDQGDNSAADAGAAYLFARAGSESWSQQAYLKASNTDGSDLFGGSVGVAGDAVAIGAQGEDSAATGVGGSQGNGAFATGAVYLFGRDDAGSWSQRAYLKASNTGNSDEFAFSVGIDTATITVGAPFEDGGASGVDGNQNDDSAASSGAAYAFDTAGRIFSDGFE